MKLGLCNSDIRYQSKHEKPLGKVFYAPTDVVLSEDTIVQPDLLFVSNKRFDIITERNIQGSTDLIIEVLSHDPKSILRDRCEKKKAYEVGMVLSL